MIVKTEQDLILAIKRFYPEGAGTEHSLIKLDLILKSVGSSFAKVMDSMKVTGSPFLKLSSRE